jgi:hypothetical protein
MRGKGEHEFMNRQTLMALTGLAVVGLAGCGNPIGNAPITGHAGPTAVPHGAGVTVTTTEWSIVVTPSAVPAGNVTLRIKNEGKQPHGIYLDGPGTDRKAPLAEPGATSELTVALPSGEFNLTDFVKDNEFAHNMRATLTVK